MVISLEIFRKPTRDKIIENIKGLGHNPEDLLILIDRAIDLALEKYNKKSNHPKHPYLKEAWGASIFEQAYTYVEGVICQDKKFDNLKDRIKSYDAVFVVGAGISFEAGIPLSRHLDDILSFCGCKNYRELLAMPEKCQKFKEQFKTICDKRQVTTSHRIICQNFKKKIIEIICLNWDNLIEKASNELGIPIPKINEDMSCLPDSKGYLWKFHGDVEKIEKDNILGKGGWVFLDEGGYVFPVFKDYAKKNLNNLFTVVVVGYSESSGDQKIAELIKVLGDSPKRPLYRIVIDLKFLSEEDYIVGPSDFVLPKIFENKKIQN